MAGVTRRQFLVGALWAGATGIAGVGVAGAASGLGRPRLFDLAAAFGPEARVVASGPVPVLGGVLRHSGRRYRIVRTRPDARGPAQAAIACLHGQGGDETYAFRLGGRGVHGTAAAAGLDVVVASFDAGPTEYYHRRRGGRDAMAALVHELIPIMDRASGGAPRAALGWSMGGFGALLAAEEHPHLFGRIAVAAPAVWPRLADARPVAFDGPGDFAHHDVLRHLGRLAHSHARVRVDCGERDPFAPAARELLRRLPNAEGAIRPGEHTHAFFQTLLPEQLAFLVPQS